MVKLIHGDCLVEMRKLAEQGVKVDSVIVDPPFGISCGKWDKVLPAEKVFDSLLPLLKKETPVLVFGKEPMASEYRLAARELYKYDLIWDKMRGIDYLRANHKPLSCYEKIMVFAEGAISYTSNADYMTYNPQKLPGVPYSHKAKKRYRSAMVRQDVLIQPASTNAGWRHPKEIIQFRNTARATHHMTEKPLDLMEWLVRSYSNEGGVVLDFTMGSGSTGVACVKLERSFIGIELDQDIFETAVKRISSASPDRVLFKELSYE